MKIAGFTDEATPDLEGQIEVLKELKWKGIETRMVGKVHFDDLDDASFEKAWAAIEKAGIEIVCYGSQIANWSRAIDSDFNLDLSELKRIIPRMHKTRTKLVRIMSYPNKGLDKPAWKKETLRRLKELTKIASDGGVILAHENCSGYGGEGWKENLELLQEINSPAFKEIFDTGNPPHHGQDAWEFYQAVKDYTIHVHIKDYAPDASAKEGWRACFPGEGRADVKRIMADLKKRNYSGWYTIEPHMAAVAHQGKSSDGTSAAQAQFVEYGRRTEALFKTA